MKLVEVKRLGILPEREPIFRTSEAVEVRLRSELTNQSEKQPRSWKQRSCGARSTVLTYGAKRKDRENCGSRMRPFLKIWIKDPLVRIVVEDGSVSLSEKTFGGLSKTEETGDMTCFFFPLLLMDKRRGRVQDGLEAAANYSDLLASSNCG